MASRNTIRRRMLCACLLALTLTYACRTPQGTPSLTYDPQALAQAQWPWLAESENLYGIKVKEIDVDQDGLNELYLALCDSEGNVQEATLWLFGSGAPLSIMDGGEYNGVAIGESAIVQIYSDTGGDGNTYCYIKLANSTIASILAKETECNYVQHGDEYEEVTTVTYTEALTGAASSEEEFEKRQAAFGEEVEVDLTGIAPIPLRPVAEGAARE